MKVETDTNTLPENIETDTNNLHDNSELRAHNRKKFLAWRKNYTNRDQLFGRLLATIELWERQQINANELTQAEVMQAQFVGAFSSKPMTTFQKIFEASATNRLLVAADISSFFNQEIENIMSFFPPFEYSDAELGAEYIAMYYIQKKRLFEKTPSLKR